MGELSDKTVLVEHAGIVQTVESDCLQVRIVSCSACSSCHAKGVCGTMDSTDKLIRVVNFTKHYNVGDNVIVQVERSLGLKALFLGYLLPFIILVVALVAGTATGIDEKVVGSVSIGLLAPYYLMLYLLRNRLQKVFVFRIKES